ALQNVTGRTLIAPPGVPKDRVTLLRRAFDAVVKDPVVLSEMTRAGLVIEPSTGEEVQDAVGRMIATPPEIVGRMRKLLEKDPAPHERPPHAHRSRCDENQHQSHSDHPCWQPATPTGCPEAHSRQIDRHRF